MMSIGTLLAYTLVAISILVLRYQPNVTIDRALADEDDLDEIPEVSLFVDSTNVKSKYFSAMCRIERLIWTTERS